MQNAIPALDERAREELGAKYEALLSRLRELAPVLVAFSGGTDSGFLLQAAHDAMGERVRGAIGVSASLQSVSLRIARRTAREIGVELLEVLPREMENPLYLANGPDRCFHCKRALYEILSDVARHAEGETVLDGTNYDDISDDRPGRAAAAMLGVRSPLADLGWTKLQIRQMSRELGMTIWNRPASPCLSSRIPHGRSVTLAALRQIEEAETRMHAYGFEDVRVRHHGALARVEVSRGDLPRLRQHWPEIEASLLECGYEEVHLSPDGYRRGGSG
jgi:uncharacterized protein